MTEIVGSPNPRLSTPPLRPYTRGPELIAFAESVGVTFLPWQRELARRALEVKKDGSWRFRTVVVCVGRQSGKTTFCKVLALWRMVTEPGCLVVGAAQSLDISREAWAGAVDLALDHPSVAAPANVRRANGEQCLTLDNRSRYRIVATTAGAGRGLSVDLLVMDEARMQRDWHAWSALSKTTIARPAAQTWVISNAGDDESVVLNALREKGLAGDDSALGLFEWSADPALPIEDPRGWAQGCPGIGHTVPLSAIAAAFGTDPPNVFRTEIRCERVASLVSAVDMDAWGSCLEPTLTLEALRDRIALCLDVSVDGRHVALVAAGAHESGQVWVESVGGWESVSEASRALPGLLERVKPAAFGFFESGPARALALEMRNINATPIKGADESEACMAFASLVAAVQVRHAGDELLSAHLAAAQPYHSGDSWRFARPRDGRHIDGAYAAAGAVFLARTLKPRRQAVYVL